MQTQKFLHKGKKVSLKWQITVAVLDSMLPEAVTLNEKQLIPDVLTVMMIT